MQFEKYNFRPFPVRLQQVNEQSEVCDVIVIVGHWERKYHKCVLQFSPFFECLFRNNFLERHTGTINLKRGTPSSVDTALLYLYGKKPKLSDDNIADLIDLAEFFMIPNLKYACVKWLESATVLEENCMHFLQLSSLYDFDLPKCNNYFIGHLVEMLSHETSLYLTCDSVNYILTEKTFSYLRMEDRLRFLARWYKTQPKHRFSWVKKFLKMLIFEEIPSTIVDELKTDLVFGQLLSGIPAGTFNPEEITPVYIFFKCPNALCFDMEHNRLFTIDLCATENVDINYIIDTDPNSPVVYFEDYKPDDNKVIAFNLETGIKKEYRVESEYYDFYGDATAFEKICCSYFPRFVHRNMCVGYVTKFVIPNIQTYQRKVISTVFIRYDEWDGDVIKMMPKFSLINGTYIFLLASNPLSEVGIVLNDNEHIFIYDNLGNSITKLEAKTNNNDQIFPTERGFVIHDDERCICITRLLGSELSQYEVKTVFLNSKFLEKKEYFFCKNIWFRLICETFFSGFLLQCVKHDTLLEATTPDDIEWNDLPLPNDSFEYCISLLGMIKKEDKIHLVGLPRRMLRCHPECPHCDAKERESSSYTSTSDSDSDEYDLLECNY